MISSIAREVILTLATLALGVIANFIWIDDVGIAILPLTTSVAAWLNALGLYVLLARRRYFRVEGWLAARLAKQLIAALAMGATIWLVGQLLGG